MQRLGHWSPAPRRRLGCCRARSRPAQPGPAGVACCL